MDLFGSGNVYRYIVAGGVELLYGTYRNHAVLLVHRFVGDERVVGVNLHAEAFAVAGNELTHIAVGVDTEAFAVDFGTGAGGKPVAGHEDHQTDGEFRNGVGVLAGSVHYDDLACRSGSEVHVVVSRTRTNDDLEVLGSLDHLGRNLVATDDDGIHIGNGFEKFALVGIFFEDDQFVTGFFHDLPDAVRRHFGKRLLSSK